MHGNHVLIYVWYYINFCNYNFKKYIKKYIFSYDLKKSTFD
jgi:hypothetical protein